jgi:hypothetical protein
MTTRQELVETLDRLLAPFEDAPPAAPEKPALLISLTPAEALFGTKRLIRFTATDICTGCEGTGRRLGKGRCRRCCGTGLETRERELQLRVPPSAADGEQLVLRGEGGRAQIGEPPDNLYVRVVVSS